jgi:hypothetical protein
VLCVISTMCHLMGAPVCRLDILLEAVNNRLVRAFRDDKSSCFQAFRHG